jgi:hypothetical protein
MMYVVVVMMLGLVSMNPIYGYGPGSGGDMTTIPTQIEEFGTAPAALPEGWQSRDTDTQEVMTTAQGELNLTAEDLQMFHNAIDYMLEPEFTGSVVVVEDFETDDFSQFL